MPPNGQNPYNQAPQQNAQGQYDVLPPLPSGQNNGHTGHNPYEFIVSPNSSKKKPLSVRGGSFGKQLLLLVGGAVVLLVVAAIVLSALSPKSASADLTTIAQEQQELIRIATAASLAASGQDTKNYLATVQLSVASSQQQVLGYLKSHGTKLGDKQLAQKKSTQTDSLLSSAQNAGTYDATVVSTLNDQLQRYQSQLSTTYKTTKSKTVRQDLQVCYASATKLLEQGQSLAKS